jgi:hypothetical protein
MASSLFFVLWYLYIQSRTDIPEVVQKAGKSGGREFYVGFTQAIAASGLQ